MTDVARSRGSTKSPRRARRVRHWKHRGVILCYSVLRWCLRYLPPGVRTVVGLLAMAAGVFGFLPLLGFWMFPLGIAIALTDIPPARRRVERWLNDTRRRYHMDAIQKKKDALQKKDVIQEQDALQTKDVPQTRDALQKKDVLEKRAQVG